MVVFRAAERASLSAGRCLCQQNFHFPRSTLSDLPSGLLIAQVPKSLFLIRLSQTYIYCDVKGLNVYLVLVESIKTGVVQSAYWLPSFFKVYFHIFSPFTQKNYTHNTSTIHRFCTNQPFHFLCIVFLRRNSIRLQSQTLNELNVNAKNGLGQYACIFLMSAFNMYDHIQNRYIWTVQKINYQKEVNHPPSLVFQIMSASYQ